jgi:hypothetical protein
MQFIRIMVNKKSFSNIKSIIQNDQKVQESINLKEGPLTISNDIPSYMFEKLMPESASIPFTNLTKKNVPLNTISKQMIDNEQYSPDAIKHLNVNQKPIETDNKDEKDDEYSCDEKN